MREVHDRYPGLEASRFTHEMMRRQITRMVEDVIGVAQGHLRAVKPRSADDVRQAGITFANFSEEMSVTDRQIKKLLFTRIYSNPDIMRIRANAAQIVTDLFDAFMENPREMQSHYWYGQIESMPEPAKARQVGDYLAGMTDTFAISTHNRLFDHTPNLR
jgi:dGTPase